MQYKDLKEMTIKEWDGEPFEAYVDDSSGELTIEEIVSYDSKYNEPWGTEQCNNYLHVYPVEWNKKKVNDTLKTKPQKMTNRQLAMWLAKGNGQMMYLSHVNLSVDKTACVQISHTYGLDTEYFVCNDRIRVRKFGSGEWIKPTIDLLDGK